MENNKRVALLTGILILAAIAVGIFVYTNKNKNSNNSQQPVTEKPAQKAVPTPVVKQLQNNKAPQGLSNNIPMSADAEILENYEASTADNRTQGTRKFTTELSLEAAAKSYTEFFAKSGWVSVDQQSDAGYKSVLMKKQNSTLLIFITADKNTGKNVVELTTTQQK